VSDQSPIDVRALFGDIDIYLFDQIQRGRVRPGMRIFDAGCGGGRNAVFFLRQGYDVSGIDADPVAIASVRALAARLAPGSPVQRFRCEPLETHSFDASEADLVVASAVFHFARDDRHFDAMVDGAWRVLAPGGLFFSRLASTIGIEDKVQPRGEGRYRLPDGSDRYLVDELRLADLTRRLGGQLADPLKTTIVQGQRAMTTWVVRKA
jgi:tellurite methyltransferase